MSTEPQDARPTCFMAMPISTRPNEAETYGDESHWAHVMESLFVVAIEAAGFRPIRPIAQGSHLIHGSIIRHLSQADLVLCDLSTHNPNVFFELGVRTSLNLPIALVRDEHTDLPFDTAGINTHRYDSNLRGWEIVAQQSALAQHIRDSVSSCSGANPLWRQFGLTIRAQEPDAEESPLAARLDLLTDRVFMLQTSMEHERQAAEMRADELSMRAMTLAERHAMDSSRSAPSELFTAAVERYANSEGHRVHVVPQSAVSAVVHIGGGWTLAALRRIEELARRYEVSIKFDPDPNSTVRETNNTVHSDNAARRKRAREAAPRTGARPLGAPDHPDFVPESPTN